MPTPLAAFADAACRFPFGSKRSTRAHRRTQPRGNVRAPEALEQRLLLTVSLGLDSGDFFGSAIASLGDLDGDGIAEIAVGAYGNDDDGENRGAVHVLFMNADGGVKSSQKISDTRGGFDAPLADGDFFGWSLAALGDLDGDGVTELAVGAKGDDSGGSGRGAVHVLFLNADGTVKSSQKISALDGGFVAALDDSDGFGESLARLGDLDGDGVTELAVGAIGDDDGGSNRGATYVLFLNADGTVKSHRKISSLEGGFTAPLDNFDAFGSSLSAIGDLDGDGVTELVVGATSDDDGGSGRGAVYILFLNSDGTVRTHRKISSLEGGFTATLDDGDGFGSAATGLGDLDGDGVLDLAVGAQFGDDPGGSARGVAYVLFLNADGTVKAHQKISDAQGNFTADLSDGDRFGMSLANLGDLNGDGIVDLAVGAPRLDDGGTDRGAVFVLFLDASGNVATHRQISDPDLPPAALSQTFFLHSNPGARHTIYLDFDGHTTTGTTWNQSYTGGDAIVTPAYDPSDDGAAFNEQELTTIQRIWQRVAEDFIPFDVNVTTQDPGAAALSKSGTGDTEWGIRVVIGGSSLDWYGAFSTGTAYYNSFNRASDTPAFVFQEQTNNGHEKSVTEAVSRIVGHTLNLRRDGTIGGANLYSGHGIGLTAWAPIMGGGTGHFRDLTQWSKGEYANADNTEDDLAIITTNNGFGYRADDHGNSAASATPLTVSATTTISGSGIIERNTDLDWFSFVTGAGAVSIDVSPFERGPNLDILASLYDAAGTLIATSNPLSTLDASFDLTLAAGRYFLSIDGTGKPASGTDQGYSDYGSLGQYFISGTIVEPPPNAAPTADAGGPYTVVAGTTVTLSAAGSADLDGFIVGYAWDLDGDGLFDDATGVSVSFVASAAGSYIVAVRVTDDWGATAVDTAVVTVTAPPTRFYVVDDGAIDRTYEYGTAGNSVENYSLGSGNTAPRGAATTAAGDRVWVIDANKKVYVYDASGGLLGSWTAGGLNTPEGIATNGTDVWVVDRGTDRVYRYANAASRLSGSVSATSSFALNSGNRDPKGIEVAGSSLWVVNDTSRTDKVFRYSLSGSLQGSWTIDPANKTPTGITLDPTNPSDVWIVDAGTDRVYRYANAAFRNSGSQRAADSFALAAGNTNPQGIADPPLSTDPLPAELAEPTQPGRRDKAGISAAVSVYFTEVEGDAPLLSLGVKMNEEFTLRGTEAMRSARPADRLDDLFSGLDELGHVLDAILAS